MRMDKFLKNSRIIKRRTVAKEACDQGRIRINDRPAKPGSEVAEGDYISIESAGGVMRIKVLALLEHAPKEAAGSMYELL